MSTPALEFKDLRLAYLVRGIPREVLLALNNLDGAIRGMANSVNSGVSSSAVSPPSKRAVMTPWPSMRKSHGSDCRPQAK